ncbi:multicopper oxidase [Macrolepiota fuliginosa MF-IS2]|uniref:Multicopper oxidase n=1 Tax=Macrolepiota fuliginosa MF-IS2 TaxID=1400762 RepID=A0A9P6BZP5_9AGAR|nr:multicopper oxidase [Macrolepiota fuliginosa MF-IS2]
MKNYFAFLAFVQVALGAAVATVKDVTIDVVNAQLAPDGFSRSTVTANGQYPGPPILVNKGQPLRITMNNKLTDPTMRRSTSLNLDGIFFGSQDVFEEAEPFVNACPVGPNATFVYNVPLGEQTGTFWYHSELSVQYVDGFRGPLIIYDPADPHSTLYDVDDVNTIIQVGDWWQSSTLPLLDNYVATGVVPVSDSGTVNGIGRFQGGPEVPWAVINVQKGRRYRFRIINESARNVFTLSIDNHDMTVIAANGVNTQPLTVQKMDMLAGQRYDVVVAANQAVGNYWFNAPFVGGNPAVNPHQNATLSRAIFRYAGAAKVDPTTPMTLGPADGALVEADLLPLVPTKVLTPDVSMTFNLVVTTGKAQWNINGVSYLSPQTPTLEKVIDGATQAADFNVTENTFILPANKTVEIIFPPTDDDDAHPFHLHGMTMQVIKSMTSNNTNTVNPISRDVVGVGGSGTTIRFKTDSTGPFMFHCHIFWHKFAGLASVQLVDPVDTPKNVQVTPAWEGLCPAYDALPQELQ